MTDEFSETRVDIQVVDHFIGDTLCCVLQYVEVKLGFSPLLCRWHWVIYRYVDDIFRLAEPMGLYDVSAASTECRLVLGLVLWLWRCDRMGLLHLWLDLRLNLAWCQSVHFS